LNPKRCHHFNDQPTKNEHVSDEKVQSRWKEQDLHLEQQLPTTTKVPVSEQVNALLRDILEHPISSVTNRYQRLGWNAYTGNRTKDIAIQKRFAFFDPVSTPTGRIKILSLTTKGMALFPAPQEQTSKYRLGGAQHEYWRHQLRRLLEQNGYAVEQEFPIGEGHSVDLRATKGIACLFIEIETGKSDVMGNIKKCQGLGGRTFFFFTAAELKAKYERTLRDVLRAVAITPGDFDKFTTQI
jgi:hypothetical protein